MDISDSDKYYNNFFEGNEAFIKETLSKDSNFFEKLSKSQAPKALIIGCVDSRVHPACLTKTEPGELFIHRNIANQVHNTDLNCLSVVQYAVEYLKVKHIIVIGHTNCGGIKAAMNHESFGMFDLWLNYIRETELNNKEKLKNMNYEEKLMTLTKLNIEQQVKNLWSLPVVQKAVSNKQVINVNGWIYKIDEGKLIDLEVKKNRPEFFYKK